MPVELKGQQLRISRRNKIYFVRFRTKDPGRHGHFQLVMGQYKDSGEWAVQSFRFNLADYKSIEEVKLQLVNLLYNQEINGEKYRKAMKIVKAWFRR